MIWEEVSALNANARKSLRFVKEIDQYKNVFRMVYLDGGKRLENDAEHSWHLAMMAWVFAPHYEQPIDLEKALKMALIHDLPEIYAGDVPAFDVKERLGKDERERRAMERLLLFLPDELSGEMSRLWDEYEAGESAEARFIQAIDKTHPVIQNILANGRSWKHFRITEEMAKGHKTRHVQGSKFFLGLLEHLLREIRRRKYAFGE